MGGSPVVNFLLTSFAPLPRMAIVLLLACGGAHAQTCTVSLPTIAFGNVDVLPNTEVDLTATVTVTCSGGTGRAIACISMGTGSASDATSRQMTSGSNTARYDLYTNANRTKLLGSWQTGYDGSNGIQLSVPKNGSNTATIYAKFFASQKAVLPGTYTATFTANPFMQYGLKGTADCPTGTSTASTSTSVTATVISNCNVSATAVNFGSKGLLTSNTDAQGTLSIQCSSSLPYTVSLDGGTSGATNPTQRKMAFSGANVTYGLYQDAARSLPWGNSVGTNTTSGTGTGSTQTQTVYGRVPVQTTPQPGSYSDSVIVTVGY